MKWRDGFSILCLTGMCLQLDLNLLNQIPLIIGSLIDLLIFVPTNGIRLLLLSIIIITKRIEQILILSSRKSTERVGPKHGFFLLFTMQ